MANGEHLALLQKGVDVWNAKKDEWWFEKGDLSGALLSKANLSQANLFQGNLSDADLSGANLYRATLYHANLSKANLSGAVLLKADLRGANLSDATLTRADLSSTKLCAATMSRATLSGANLSLANLQTAILYDANFTGADLRVANLCVSTLSGANLSRAEMGSTVLGNVDLSDTTGLESIRHSGPSTIGIDTIYRSKGHIPEIFLRRAGVPDRFIMYSRYPVGSLTGFHSCFISYSTSDQDFADRLYADLQANGVRCWFAPHDVQGGRKIHEQIDEAILIHDKLLLILSEASMSSKWVKTEIANARAREQQQDRHMLFPITIVPFDKVRAWKCFDADTGIDSAREIREYFIPDFSNWKDHDSYQKPFEQLLKDLTPSSSLVVSI